MSTPSCVSDRARMTAADDAGSAPDAGGTGTDGPSHPGTGLFAAIRRACAQSRWRVEVGDDRPRRPATGRDAGARRPAAASRGGAHGRRRGHGHRGGGVERRQLRVGLVPRAAQARRPVGCPQPGRGAGRSRVPPRHTHRRMAGPGRRRDLRRGVRAAHPGPSTTCSTCSPRLATSARCSPTASAARAANWSGRRAARPPPWSARWRPCRSPTTWRSTGSTASPSRCRSTSGPRSRCRTWTGPSVTRGWAASTTSAS